MDAATNQVQIGVWYILAGIVVGFAASTLWEWLYFRGRRLAVKERDPDELTNTGSPTQGSPAAMADDASIAQAQLVLAQSGARMDIEHLGALAAAVTASQPWSPVASSRTPSPVPSVAALAAPAVAALAAQPTRSSTPPHVARSRGYPDDLTQIPGIEATQQQRLYAANIFTWHQVATSDVEVLRQFARPAPEAKVESWPAQARSLAERFGRTSAAYSGPPPEDLTRIGGITAVQKQMLYKAGICSTAQLAATTRAELEQLFGSAPGELPDIDAWLVVAKKARGT